MAWQTVHDFFHLPEPEVVDGRPRVIRAQAGVRSDVGFLNFASTGTAVAALVVLAVVASCAARTAVQVTGPTVLIASLAAGAVVGRWRFRGKFSGMPGVILAVVVGIGVEILAILTAALIGGGDALMLVLEAAGRRRGRRRRRHETLVGYARVLAETSVPDPRLIEVAAVMTQSCFMATEIDPARRVQAEATLDDIIAGHPAPGWARRVRRAVGL